MGPGESVLSGAWAGWAGWLSSGGTLCEISGPPHISHDSREGWFRKVHRGHWNEASGSDAFGGLARADDGSLPPTDLALPDWPRGRTGRGDDTACLLVALLIVAFKT